MLTAFTFTVHANTALDRDYRNKDAPGIAGQPPNIALILKSRGAHIMRIFQFRNRAHTHRLASILVLALLFLVPLAGGDQSAPAASLPPVPDDWITVNKDYSSQRFAKQDQITPANVTGLKEACEIDLNEPSWFSSGILKIGNTLYFTTRRVTYAVDAATCQLRWRYVNEETPFPVNYNNRGLGYWNGTLFKGTTAGHLIALDAATGKVKWDTQAGDPTKLQSIIAAPIAWNGMVFTGIATADLGVIGEVMAFDAKTGKPLWSFATIPPNSPAALRGGAFWTTFSLDPSTGELFAPSSNPYPDYTGDERAGNNVYTDAVLALDAITGKLRWYYQAVAHDVHDWDLGTAPALYRTHGKDMLAIAGKDGFVYVIDRKTHKLAFTAAGTTQVNGNAPFPTNAGQIPTKALRVCPGSIGGAQFTAPAYASGNDTHSDNDTLFIGMNDWCWFYYSTPQVGGPPLAVADRAKPNAGEMVGVPGARLKGVQLGHTQPDFALGTPPRGWITAIDAQTGAVRWQYHADAQVQAGVVPTRSGIVFAADTLGNILALDAKSGKKLHSVDAEGAINSGLISYGIGGTQYVAAEVGGLSLNPPGITHPLRVGGPLRLKIFALNARTLPAAHLDRVPLAGTPYVQPNEMLYKVVCGACHGAAGAGSAFPTLSNQEHALTDPARLKAFFENVPPPMPKLYPGLLNDNDIDLLVSYFRQLPFASQPGYTPPKSAGVSGWPAVYSVMTSPRCINCHTMTDFPRQTDERHPHYYGVVRGADNQGMAIARCTTCHGTSNNPSTGVPGAPVLPHQTAWQLAPLSMAWEAAPNIAMSGAQLCAAIQNQATNGHRNLAALLDHVSTGALVQWAFNPGANWAGQPRSKPPISYKEFIAAFTTWANAGGPCPAP